MFSPRISRFRAAMILAVAVLVWSEAALASFVCPHMSGCEHGMPASSDPATPAEGTATSDAMECCPVNNSEATMDCNASAMECCAWHRDSDTSAVLFASDHPRPKQFVAVLPATIPAAPSLTLRETVPGLNADLAYVKPVTQKKTDLRI